MTKTSAMVTAAARIQTIANHISPSLTPQQQQNGFNHEKYRVHRKHKQDPYHTPLDPIRFLLRSAMVYSKKTAIIHKKREYDYETFADRVLHLANALIHSFHVRPGDRVAILCQNIPAYIEAMYAVPSVGGILVPFNARLIQPEIEYMIKHSGATLLIVQDVFLTNVSLKVKEMVKMIHVNDYCDNNDHPHLDYCCQYEQLVQKTDILSQWNDLPLTVDENAILSINYTSGSTGGKPKGVMVSYRGCYLMTLSMCLHAHLASDTKYLWTAPLFHCNGWSFPWAVVAMGGTQVMLNKVDYALVWKLLKEGGITHYGAAATVQSELCNHKDACRLDRAVHSVTGASPVAVKVLEDLNALNIYPIHAYGLTETFGPSINTYDSGSLSQYPKEQHSSLVARQGYSVLCLDETRVLDQVTGKDVVPDGKHVGEICCSGNLTMLGYYNDPEENKRVFRGGVFWTGDLGVRHPDGAVEVVDRAKDIIISGGENISSIELEKMIIGMEPVVECGVVSGPDEKWGERPYAYVVVRQDRHITADEIIAHCRKNLAGYKCPAKVIFVESLPKTSTGKIKKHLVREELWKSYKKQIN
ncbi:hypothetical protein BDA99DRAFT_495544 [Phascolomyces articulosus]|uniref:Uncharacterized protein n=1 Tax=Phascolomyces articulosus TaxID=60185 RepID=A0AAD5PIV4_9FUNG|nr:hypothetical protein BDA99DRAFT_495544 [Phascolomyces articulosus]